MNWLNEDAKIAYEMLIADGSPEKLDGYCEEHHIIPRSMGGTDEPENLTYLTASTHLYVHYWLWVGTGDQKLGHAYFHMSNTNWHKYDATPMINESMVQAYEEAKIAHSKATSELAKLRTGEKSPRFGKAHSVETKEKLRKANTGKTASPETLAKKSAASSGEKNPMFGKTGSLSPGSKRVLMNIDCGLTFSYGSAMEASRCLGLGPQAISKRCRRGAKGFSYAPNNDVSTTGADR